MDLWTNDDRNKILLQLEEKYFLKMGLFFIKDNDNPVLINKGGSGYVYEMFDQKRGLCALKIIGFLGKYIDEEKSFLNQVRSDFVVKQYEYKNLWVFLDENDNVTDIKEEKPETEDIKCLRLQYILMEKLNPIIKNDHRGNISIYPDYLVESEREILKFATDIGTALDTLHMNNILHRDVKLENVFFDVSEDKYKLGDFGIAKKTADGFADTVAFTKGYVAPEVIGKNGEKYDNTADIYSFGMMLFVLSNNLRFPESKTYNTNMGVQYSTGYVLPKPSPYEEYTSFPPLNKYLTNLGGKKTVVISDEFYEIIKKACMYDPDDRYQSMADLLDDIKKLYFKDGLGYYERAHKKANNLAIAIMLSFGAYILKTDFKAGNEWLAITLIILGIVFIFRNALLVTDIKNPHSWAKSYRREWLCLFLIFILIAINGALFKLSSSLNLNMPKIYRKLQELPLRIDLQKIGIAGCAFLLFWLIRLKFLSKKNQ